MSEGVSISHRIAQVGFSGGSVSRIRAAQMRFLRWVQVGLKNIAKTDEFLFCLASMFYFSETRVPFFSLVGRFFKFMHRKSPCFL